MGRILEGKLEQRERSGVEGLTADTGHGKGSNLLLRAPIKTGRK